MAKQKSKGESGIPQLHSMHAIAEKLGVSRAYLSQQVTKGKLRAVRLGRRVACTEQQVKDFLDERRTRRRA